MPELKAAIVPVTPFQQNCTILWEEPGKLGVVIDPGGDVPRLLEAIRDFWYANGRRIGMKPAGGISKAKLALQYLVMVRETLGQDWLTPELFRFGASSLVNDILMQLEKQATGAYQSADYFSRD